MQIIVPGDIAFADLRLSRAPGGAVNFDWRIIERLCVANDFPAEHFRLLPEDAVAGFIIAWYTAHRESGGLPDPVADDLFAEVLAEELAGQNYSHKPGLA